ncbi:hypothetical protein Tco_0157049 [Tanacetum coccineum]
MVHTHMKRSVIGLVDTTSVISCPSDTYRMDQWISMSTRFDTDIILTVHSTITLRFSVGRWRVTGLVNLGPEGSYRGLHSNGFSAMREPDHISKSERGISINKEKDVNDLLRMYDKIDSSVNTPVMPPNMLGPDLNSKAQPEAMFSTEAEDIAAAGCYAIILWIESTH